MIIWFLHTRCMSPLGSDRQREISRHWPTTVAQSIRRSCMYLEGCSPADVLKARSAVTRYTSSTQNMVCGISRLWRVTVLCPGLGKELTSSFSFFLFLIFIKVVHTTFSDLGTYGSFFPSWNKTILSFLLQRVCILQFIRHSQNCKV